MTMLRIIGTMVAVAACSGPAKPPQGAKPIDPTIPSVDAPTGLLLYQDDDALRWIDLASREGGEVSPPLGYPDWSRPADDAQAAWVHGYAADSTPVVVVVRRDGATVRAHSLDRDVLGVAPDGTRAVVPCPDEFHWCVVPVRDDTLGNTTPLTTDADYPELAGWMDDGRVVVVDLDAEDPISIVDPGSGSVIDGGEVDATETPIVSSDGATLAWLTSDDDDFATAVTRVSWRPLDDLDAEPHVVDIGAGYTGECTFAAGGKSLVCLLMLYDEDRSRVVVVDLATKKQRTISEVAVSVWPAVSPDGAHVAFAEEHDGVARLVIAPVVGGASVRVFGDGDERQFAVAWLR